MSKFRFSLEAALQWRKHLLLQERVKLQALEAKRDSTMLMRENTLARLTGTKTPEAIDAASLQQGAAHRTFLSALYLRLQNTVLSESRSVAEQLARCVEADRQCRVLEKLRGAKLACWESGMRKKSDDEAAEIYSAKWTRRNSS